MSDDYWWRQRYDAMHERLHPAPRILITGSRALTDVLLVEDALKAAVADLGADAVIVHGGASGADELAASLASTLGLTCEQWPADWKGRGRAAGPMRNQAMVDAGADICLVFLLSGAENRGTKDCWRRAERAGIPERVFTQDAT